MLVGWLRYDRGDSLNPSLRVQLFGSLGEPLGEPLDVARMRRVDLHDAWRRLTLVAAGDDWLVLWSDEDDLRAGDEVTHLARLRACR